MVAEDETAPLSAKNKDTLFNDGSESPQRLGRVGQPTSQGDEPKCPHHGRYAERKDAIKSHRLHQKAPQVDDEEDAVDEDEPAMDTEADEEEPIKKVRHIHPCICDLSRGQRKRIKAHLDHQTLMHRKYNTRIREIEEELTKLEEERLEREREMEEQQELFGDEYELIGTKKKRKKRSARRASMVSLGVKQVINWRKAPKIVVKLNKASKLRKEFASYCGRRPFPDVPWKQLSYGEEPKVKVRVTRAFSLRMKFNQQKVVTLLAAEDKKTPFDIPSFV